MKAVVFRGIGDIRLEDVKEPKIQKPTDAIVRLTASAICGTDLHAIRGTLPGMKPGTILGHEGVGIVEEVGRAVRNFKPGDRVVIPSTIACGNCSYCRAGYYAQCDKANPNGPDAGTAFLRRPAKQRPFRRTTGDFARIPFANVGLVKVPDEVTDDQAIPISDIVPTAWMAAEFAEICPGNTVAVFGCGPVGQFVIASAKLMNVGRIFAIDTIPSRLEMAQEKGAEIINFDNEDPVEAIKEFTDGIGVDRVIDAVGVDATHPHHGPAARKSSEKAAKHASEVKTVAPKDGNWHPGDAPSQVFEWAIAAIAKAGTLSIIGVYPETAEKFPIGQAMEKNLTLKMGNCNHRKYIPMLLEKVQSGVLDPSKVLTNMEPITAAIDAYKAFDTRQPGWIKVKLEPSGAEAAAA